MNARPASRRFTLADALILIGFTAVGLALARALARADPLLDDGSGVFHVVGFVHTQVVPVLAALTFAVLALILRRPRPPLRRLALRPGFMVNGAAATGLTLLGLRGFGMLLWNSGPYDPGRLYLISADLAYEVGLVVVGVLPVVALGRRCHAGSSWVDRMGQVTGASWLVLLALMWLWPFLS